MSVISTCCRQSAKNSACVDVALNGIFGITNMFDTNFYFELFSSFSNVVLAKTTTPKEKIWALHKLERIEGTTNESHQLRDLENSLLP
jgi:hypothetical protein